MSNSQPQNSSEAKGEIEQSILGPDYKYYNFIKTPAELGMSGEGTLETLGKDIRGLMSYTQLLVSGKGEASATGEPLGNKFFLKTGAKCRDKASSNDVDRSIYINNVPSGVIPFLTSGTGVQFTEFSGLIPGTLENITRINPMKIFTAFANGTKPDCRAITMQVIDENNIKSVETKYVTDTDISDIPACSFTTKKNPITNNTCKEAFTTSGQGGSFGSSGRNNRNRGGGRSSGMYSYSTPIPKTHCNHNIRKSVVDSTPYEIGRHSMDDIVEIDDIVETDDSIPAFKSKSKCVFANLFPENVSSNNIKRIISSYDTVPSEIIKKDDIISNSGFPDDIYIKIYFSALGLFGLYLLTKMMQKQGAFKI